MVNRWLSQYRSFRYWFCSMEAGSVEIRGEIVVVVVFYACGLKLYMSTCWKVYAYLPLLLSVLLYEPTFHLVRNQGRLEFSVGGGDYSVGAISISENHFEFWDDQKFFGGSDYTTYCTNVGYGVVLLRLINFWIFGKHHICVAPGWPEKDQTYRRVVNLN